MSLDDLAADPRVLVRWAGPPDPDGEAVVYWMQRAQRAVDNPALDVAVALGNLLRKPVVVFFGLHPSVAGGNHRHYHFLAEGLGDVADGLARRRVGFVLRRPAEHRLMAFLAGVRPAMLVGDENPLRQMEAWRDHVAAHVQVPFWTVDADVVVPSALMEKQQYAARTIRPRIQKRLDEFLVRSSDPSAAVPWPSGRKVAHVAAGVDILRGLRFDRSVGPVDSWRGGTAAARRQLRRFVAETLAGYDTARNHPERDGTSRLSPHLHFGHIGPREVALAVRDSGADPASVAALLEQLVVRRELAVNFVRYNGQYDRLDGCERWARQTLHAHERDPRPHLYTAAEFDAAETHDPLWNAAQRQMVESGWMHGYIRMYWAKKLLEWSATPAEAFSTAVALNDRYELDGRDPNGYTNIAWAIGGKHDRPWPRRPVYGTVRSMSSARTAKKFDADLYIERWTGRPRPS